MSTPFHFPAARIQAIAADKDAEKKLKRFDVLAYSGGILRLPNFAAPVIIDLNGLQLEEDRHCPALKNHNSRSPVGHCEWLAIHDGQLSGQLVLSLDNADSREIAAGATNGFDWQVSVGVSPEEEENIEAGRNVSVNGRRFDGPVIVCRRGTLKEISFVALGADDGNKATLAAMLLNKEQSTMDTNKFESWCEEHGFDITAVSEEEQDKILAIYADDLEKQVDERLKAQLQGSDIQASEADSIHTMLESRRIKAIDRVPNLTAEIRAQAIQGNWDKDRTELEVMRRSRPVFNNSIPTGPRNGGGGASERDAVEASLLIRAGYANIAEATLGERACQRADDMRIRSLEDMFDRVGLGRRSRRIEAAGWSTTDLAETLSNVSNKVLLDSYEAFPSAARQFAKKVPYKDFKEKKFISEYASVQLEEVGPGGELKHGQLADSSKSGLLKTYGRMLTLTRQMIVNDDLDVFSQIPQQLGRAAAQSLEEYAFSVILANGGSFFSAGNSNYASGAGTALSITSLKTAEQLMLKQTDENGKPIAVSGRFVLVPPELSVTIKQLLNSVELNRTGDSSPIANPFNGAFTPLVSPYLSNTAMTGYSATGWYLIAGPADLPFAVVGHLDGVSKPVIEPGETSFDTLGMQWRCYVDYDFVMIGEKSAVFMAGA